MTLHPMPEAIREAFERCRDMDASLTERLEAFAQESEPGSVQRSPPVVGAQQLDSRGCDWRALAPGHAVKVDGSPQIEPHNRCAHQGRGTRRTRWNDGNAEIGLEHLHEIAFTDHFMRSFNIDLGMTQHFGDLVPVLTIGSRQKPLLPELFDFQGADVAAAKKLMRARSTPAAPNSLTAASNSTSLCSAPMTSRNSLTIGISKLVFLS